MTERKKREGAKQSKRTSSTSPRGSKSAEGIPALDASLRAFLEAVPCVVLVLAPDGRILEFNREAEQIYGRKREEVLGQDYYQLFLPEDAREPVAADIREVLSGKQTRGFENPIRDASGNERQFGWHVNRVEDNEGSPVGIVAVGLEITERREAEARIENLNALEEGLLAPGNIEEKAKRITDGVLRIFDADFARIWLTRPGDRCNSGCLHAAATEGPHVCRHRERCLHLVASSGRYTHLDGEKHARVPYGCYKIGRVAAAQDAGFVTNDVVHDERVHDHEWARRLGLVSFAGYRLVSPEGTPIGVLALFSKHPLSPDETTLLETVAGIASQVVQSAGIEEERSHLAAVLELTSDLVSTATPDGRLTYMNRAGRELLGWGVDDDISSRRIADAHPQWAEGIIVGEGLPAAAREGVWRGETALRCLDGTEIPVSQVIMGHGIEEGEPQYFSTIMRDISERKQAEKERSLHVWFLESLERIEEAIRRSDDVEQMLWDAMAAVRDLFGCDRAWLLYPCDPDAPSFRVPVEVTAPEYPGVFSLDVDVPMKPGGDQVCAQALATDNPVTYVPGGDHPLYDELTRQYEVQSLIALAIHPKIGKPWALGLHQCSYPREWTENERRLLTEIGRRLADALSSLLFLRDLREREARLASIFRAAPVGIGLVSDRAIKQVNQRACETLGRSREEFIGQSTRVLYPSDEEYERVGREIYRQIAERGAGTVEAQCARKDGKIVEVLLSATPLDPANPEKDLTFIAMDITERKRAEERESEARRVAEAVAEAGMRYLETAKIQDMAGLIVERALDIIGAEMGFLGERLSDGSFRILALSEMAWKVMEGGSLYTQAREALEQTGGFTLPRVDNALFRALGSGEVFVGNDTGQEPWWQGGPEGHPSITSVLLVPLMAAQEVVGLIGVANRPGGFSENERRELEAFAPTAALAISRWRSEQERRLLEDQLLQSQKMEAVGQLAGGVAHDFNNLLQAILGYVSLAMTGLPPEEERYGYLAEVMRASEQAASLTQQLLAFSRRQVIQPKAIDLNQTVSDLIRMLRRVIGEHVELNVMLGERLKPVYADAGQLGQVLINLCVNARDAMPEGGRLTIETRNVQVDSAFLGERPEATEGEYVLFSVTDTGSGMTPEVVEHVYEPFYTTKAPGKGTGLGLATVYGIVKQHQGIITVKSELGQGSSFTVYLPISAEAVRAEEQHWPEQLPIGTETILLAEDEEIVRNLALEVLQGAGYTVLVARDGAEAVSMFQDHLDEVSLVLLDAVMPRMNGRTAFEKMRALKPGLPALFCSGYSFSMLETDYLEKTGARTISKPYTVPDLLRSVREAIG